MSYVSQQSKLFGFSVPLYPADSYTGVITNVPEDATEILSLKGEMIDFTNITQYSDIVLHSDDNYSVRIRREDTYIHLEILEVSTNQTGVLWWTGFGNTYRWWICVSIDDVSGDIYLFAVSDANHTWINRGMNDHSPISGTGSTGLLIKRFFKNTQISGGGAGSGYIGNSLVSNKKMVGYNVPTSSAESTKTESVEDASESPVSGKPKIGNGYARIKLVSQEQEYDIDSLLKNKNLSDSSQYSIVYAEGYSAGIGNRIPNFVGTNTILGCSTVSASNFTLPNYLNGLFDLTAMTNQGYGYICIPIKPMYVSKVSFEYKIFGSGFNNEDFKVLLCSDDGSSISHYDMRIAPPLNPTDWTSMEYIFTSSEFEKLYTYLAIQRNSMQVQVRNLKIDGTLKP